MRMSRFLPPTAQLLRGLVQHVLSFRRSFADLSEALLLPGFGDKTAYVRHDGQVIVAKAVIQI